MRGAGGPTVSRSSAPTLPHVAGLAADGHSGATLQAITGTPALTIGVVDLGVTGTLLLGQHAACEPGPATANGLRGGNPVVSLSAADASAITVTLNAAVSWQLDLAACTTRTVADLVDGRVAGIVVNEGLDVIDLTLPRPDGSVTIRAGGRGEPWS